MPNEKQSHGGPQRADRTAEAISAVTEEPTQAGYGGADVADLTEARRSTGETGGADPHRLAGQRLEHADPALYLALSSNDPALLADCVCTAIAHASEALSVLGEGVLGDAGKSDGADMASSLALVRNELNRALAVQKLLACTEGGGNG